jgi:polysaccharide deacetylase 2 family uncharacterized protein YibQ
MAADELTKPLGLPPPPDAGRKRRLRLAAAGAAAVLVLAGATTAYVVLSRPHPVAIATIAGPPKPAAVAPDVTGSTARIGPPPAPLTPMTPAMPALTEVQPAEAPPETNGAIVIHDASMPPPVRLAAAPRGDLVEPGPYGPLPRVAADGTRPLDAYARPAASDAGTRRVAIIVGGIGIAHEATETALEQLPGAVSLAFVPYGDALPKVLAEARAAGHEVLLQIPLEPFGYPQNNPGPHTLTTDASAAQNLDRLHWLMARLTTYVGVVSYMGSRFTAEPKALAPVIADVGARGLLYVDDGSSATSRAAEVTTGAPFLRADVVLDSDASPAAIGARLDQLADIARQRGFAVGMATAFPASIDQIAAFARSAANRGITLVPVSALVQSGRS